MKPHSSSFTGLACRIAALAIFLALALAAQPAAAQERDRTKVPEALTWNLTALYPSDEAWQQARAKLAAEIPSIATLEGTLGKSAKDLEAALDRLFDLEKTLARLAGYATLRSDTDTRVAKYQELKQAASKVGTDLAAASAYLEPEILALDRAKVDRWISREKGLAEYRQYLDDILRRKPHTLSAGEEKIIADVGLMAGAAGTIRGIFADADFPYPTVTLADGRSVEIDQSSFGLQRQSANREDRKKVFAAFFGALYQYRGTFGAQLYASLQRDVFYMKARQYPTTLESALDSDNIPPSVYTKLLEGVHASLPTFHRYLKLRQRMLGVDQLHYYDLYAPLVKGVDLAYDTGEAKKHILAAMAPLGPEYVAAMRTAFEERWIDMYPTEGKRSGAYMEGDAYDVHPYMLMNYNGKYEDVTTLAHEAGHAMQSHFSNETQPYPTARYPIFVAEVASTFNEALLIDHMLKSIEDPGVRLALLGNVLEGIKTTLFRQTQFAEFELRTHEMAEKGEALTGDALSRLYLEMTRKYYGHAQGVCIVDDEIQAEWAYIPHFFYNYYVYQYATSYTASAALSEPVLAGDKAALERYLDFIAAGSSKYPIDLLADAGVDMTSTKPFEFAMKRMSKVMDEMEKLLEARDRAKK